MIPAFELSVLNILLVAITSYLIGSVPFGLILAKLLGLGNLRDIGSGNIGATNVLRTGNKLAAILTLVFDLGKGTLAVLTASLFYGEAAAQIAGLASFLGHCFPVWLKFKGGKGVATFIGILLALYWPAGILTCLTWISTAFISRISSLSALISSAASIFWIWLLDKPDAVFVITTLTIFIWLRHRNNISRIIAGTETKINK